MSAQDPANIQAQAQAEAQLTADAQATTQAQQVPVPQVIGPKPGIVKGPALLGATGVYRTASARRVGPAGIIRRPALLGATGVYTTASARTVATTTYPAATLLGGVRTRATLPPWVHIVDHVPAEVVDILRDFTPLRPLIPEEVDLINTFRVAIEDNIPSTFAVWDPQGIQIKAVAGIESFFYVATEFGILLAGIKTGLDGISVLNFLFPALGDAAEPAPGPEGYTPVRTPAPEEIALVNTFKPAIQESLGKVGLSITKWEPLVVQAKPTLGTFRRFIINTNAGLVQATIFTDLQGNSELSAENRPVFAAPIFNGRPQAPFGGFSLPRTISFSDLQNLDTIRTNVEQSRGLVFTIWEPLTTQTQNAAGSRYNYLVKTNLGVLFTTLFYHLNGTFSVEASIRVIPSK